MTFGYARCSTDEKTQDIRRQVRELKQQGATDKTIFTEYASGMKEDRAELAKLLTIVQPGDTIVATEVSRISRSTKHLCELIEFAKDRHIKLVFGSFVVDCTGELDPATEGVLKLIAVFSEMERNITAQRVRSGIANARAKGKQIGRPETTADDIPAVFYKHYPKYKNGEINKAELSRLCGISYPSTYKYLRIVEGPKMKVSVCSRKEAEQLLQKGFPKDTAVISFYDTENSHLTYGNKAASVMYVPMDDFQTDVLDAARIAAFVKKASKQGLNILCQCEAGQSRSAGCAAAIREYYYHDGQALFDNERYHPDETIYYAVLSALEAKSGRGQQG